MRKSMEKMNCQELCARTQKQVLFMMNYCRSNTERNGMEFALSRLSTFFDVTTQKEYLDRISAIREEIKMESRAKWGLFHRLFGFHVEWENGGYAALNTALEMLRSVELKEGRFHLK